MLANLLNLVEANWSVNDFQR